MTTPLVGIIMGSSSDWETMQPAADMLTQLGIAHEVRDIKQNPAYARDLGAPEG